MLCASVRIGSEPPSSPAPEVFHALQACGARSDVPTRLEHVLDVLVHIAGADGGLLLSPQGASLASIGFDDAEMIHLAVSCHPRARAFEVHTEAAPRGRLRCECTDVPLPAGPPAGLVLCVRDDAPSRADMGAIRPYLPAARRALIEATTGEAS